MTGAMMRLAWIFLLLLAPLAASCGNPTPPSAGPGNTIAELRGPHERIDNMVRHTDTVVLVSFFGNGRMTVAQHCWICADGSRGMVRFMTNWAVQGGGAETGVPGATMPAAQRTALSAALARLPASQTFGGDADAFLVSWDDGGKWVTRTYDRTKLPPEVLELCKLVSIPPTWL
jgi:hypothetical protein